MKKADFLKKSPPYGGRMVLIFWFLDFKKAGCFQPVFFDFGGAEIGSFLILILYRNISRRKNSNHPLSVKGYRCF
ncbi:hypothetical protein D9C08_23330 (plasmid) [Bacillus subtilis subsp. subtilis]|nr:hypothetical protein D9C12_23310 [Bacillus subtilis subsp. subtilis]AYL03282.1 hypothetical protein D9C08_23330 [Bacillus subtilis subsp. subtilis]